MRDEKNWYRCTTRNEMVKLINAGFKYTNFRKDKVSQDDRDRAYNILLKIH